jgi:hypothetical protein
VAGGEDAAAGDAERWDEEVEHVARTIAEVV